MIFKNKPVKIFVGLKVTGAWPSVKYIRQILKDLVSVKILRYMVT